MKTIRKIDWGLIGFIGVLLASLGYFVATHYSPFANSEKPNANGERRTSNRPTVIYTAKDSTTHAKKEVVAPVSRTPTTSATEQIQDTQYKGYVKDTLAKALDVAVEKIREITRIKAKLEGELHATKIELTKSQEQKVYYQNKYLSIITYADSLGNPQHLKYTYNAEINVAHFTERRGFWSKERYFIDVSSPDKNFKINGLEHYREPLYIRPKRVGVGFQVGYGLTQDFKVQPYMGVGVSWNVIRL